MKNTLQSAKTYLGYRGMTITKKDSEYRVNFTRDGNEDTAYYTNDLDDAIGTGDAMASAKMMRNEDSWPTWPRLPLKRRGHGMELQTAVLIIGGNLADSKYCVYETNLFMDIKDDTPCTRYATEHEVVAAGWRVD